MKTILGLDLGPSSIGWALINTENEKSVKERAGSSLSQRMLSALVYKNQFALRLSERPFYREEKVSQRH